MTPASSKRSPRRGGLLTPLVLAVLAVAIAALGPRLVRAHAALQWTRHHVASPPDEAGQNAKGAAKWAVLALSEGAPAPWGAYACRLALDFGVRQEATNSAAALSLYRQVRGGLEAMVATRWRGLGLGALLEEARQREQVLQARPDPPR